MKLGRCSIPCEPTSSVMGVVLYLAHSVADTSSPYFVSFVSLAYSNNVLKQTVISTSDSHPTKPCLDASQLVQREGESARWLPGQQ